MKIIKENAEKYHFYLSSYEMDSCYHSSSMPAGLVLLYTLVNQPVFAIRAVTLDLASAEADSYGKERCDRFEFLINYPDCRSLCRKFAESAGLFWEIELEDGSLIHGDMENEVRMLCEYGDISFAQIMTRTEKRSFEYCEDESDADVSEKPETEAQNTMEFPSLEDTSSGGRQTSDGKLNYSFDFDDF